MAVLGSAAFTVLAGCTSAPQKSAAAVAEAREERCQVTGSNLPRRDCRNDVTVLPPSAVDQVMPVQPGAAPRN
jgi:hypothetical protein